MVKVYTVRLESKVKAESASEAVDIFLKTKLKDSMTVTTQEPSGNANVPYLTRYHDWEEE